MFQEFGMVAEIRKPKILISLEFYQKLSIDKETIVIDSSHWDDFKFAKEDNVIGVIHKATQGLEYIDPKYAKRRKATEEERLLWGAYHFGVGKDGRDQAEHFLKTVGDYSQVLLALDIEENQSGENITPKQAEDFVTRIYEVTGRLPLIYGSAYFLEDFATPILTKCPLWIARWGEEPVLPKGWKEWTLWQYTNGQADKRNKFNGTLEELKDFWIS